MSIILPTAKYVSRKEFISQPYNPALVRWLSNNNEYVRYMSPTQMLHLAKSVADELNLESNDEKDIIITSAEVTAEFEVFHKKHYRPIDFHLFGFSSWIFADYKARNEIEKLLIDSVEKAATMALPLSPMYYERAFHIGHHFVFPATAFPQLERIRVQAQENAIEAVRKCLIVRHRWNKLWRADRASRDELNKSRVRSPLKKNDDDDEEDDDKRSLQNPSSEKDIKKLPTCYHEYEIKNNRPATGKSTSASPAAASSTPLSCNNNCNSSSSSSSSGASSTSLISPVSPPLLSGTPNPATTTAVGVKLPLFDDDHDNDDDDDDERDTTDTHQVSFDTTHIMNVINDWLHRRSGGSDISSKALKKCMEKVFNGYAPETTSYFVNDVTDINKVIPLYHVSTGIDKTNTKCATVFYIILDDNNKKLFQIVGIGYHVGTGSTYMVELWDEDFEWVPFEKASVAIDERGYRNPIQNPRTVEFKLA